MATILGLEAAALLNFVGHCRWTWRDHPVATMRGYAARFGRYQLAKTASLGANLAITTALAGYGLPVEVANALAVGVCALPNYFVADRLIFATREDLGRSPRPGVRETLLRAVWIK
jgi:putative flippase GtrA